MIIDDVSRRSVYQDGKMVNVLQQDESGYIDENARERNSHSGHSRIYNGKNMVRTMNITLVGIEKMANGQCCVDAKVNNRRFDLLSADPEERRRTLLHIQNHHKEYMVVPGNPFGRKKTQWR